MLIMISVKINGQSVLENIFVAVFNVNNFILLNLVRTLKRSTLMMKCPVELHKKIKLNPY